MYSNNLQHIEVNEIGFRIRWISSIDFFIWLILHRSVFDYAVSLNIMIIAGTISFNCKFIQVFKIPDSVL